MTVRTLGEDLDFDHLERSLKQKKPASMDAG